MAGLERPKLMDGATPPARRAVAKPPSDFRRRLSYYLSGVAIGLMLAVPIVMARCSTQRGRPPATTATP
jgi:hypothetical protein